MKKRIISTEVLFFTLMTTVFFLMNTLFAAEVKVANVTNEEDREVVNLVLITDDNNGDLVGFRHDSYLENGNLSGSESEDLNLLDKGGILLKQTDGYKVVIMKSENFALHKGGSIELDTLYNGATGERRSYHLELLRNGDDWSLERAQHKVERIHLKSNKVFLLGTVGIADVKTDLLR